MQGNFFRGVRILYCSVLSLGGKVINTRRMSQPDMGSIFQIKNQWNILVLGSYYVNYQNYQNSMLLSSSDTERTLRHLFLFTNSAGENWFQYVRRVYMTANNFPCIIPLIYSNNEEDILVILELCSTRGWRPTTTNPIPNHTLLICSSEPPRNCV